MTVRRRALVALLIWVPVAYLYVYVAGYILDRVVRQYRSGFVACDAGTFRHYLNHCGAHFNAFIAWLELVVGTGLLAGLAFLLARWAAYPLRSLAAAIDRFGPTSTGLRVDAEGPVGDETRVLAESTNAMLDRLQAGYEAQRRFASNASHELRTPLATQRALIEISLASALTPEQLGLLSRQLLATNERNERLVDGLLTLAESDRGVLAHEPVALDRIAADTLAHHEASAAERHVTLHAELEPTTVVGEAALLERLVANLVQNAVKYNRPGGSVDVRVADRTLTVSNTGDPVPGDEVTPLFEPFRRLAGDRLDHGGGVGLGLTIVRSIAAAHDGELFARPNPGGGLSISVRFAP
jgi:signal transduction histidine kinase